MDLSTIKEISNKYFTEYSSHAENSMLQMIFDYSLPDFVKNDFKTALEYNVRGGNLNVYQGKKVRGRSLMELYFIFSKDLGVSNIKNVALFGWMVEYMQAFLLILDDIMDNSEMRRDNLCWYKKPEIGLTAINDAFLIKSSIFKLLYTTFGQFPYYNSLNNLVIDTLIKTSIGQALDMRFCKYAQHTEKDFTKFTLENYKLQVLNKTTHYSFILPFLAAYQLSQASSYQDFVSEFIPILHDIGYLFQVQDDYLDVFGDPKITGKIGSDIQEGKLTWLVVELLPHLSANDLIVFKNAFGHSDKHHVAKVVALYEKYGIKTKYNKFANDFTETTIQKIHKVAPSEFSEYYKDYLLTIHDRRR